MIEAELTVTHGNLHNTGLLSNGDGFAFGSDTRPPNSAAVSAFPELAADSWITLPGSFDGSGNSSFAAFAEPNRLDENGTLATYFSALDTGPQTDFRFARITLVPDTPDGDVQAVLRVTAHAHGDPLPISTTFEYVIGVPEPDSMALLMCAFLGALAVRRRR